MDRLLLIQDDYDGAASIEAALAASGASTCVVQTLATVDAAAAACRAREAAAVVMDLGGTMRPAHAAVASARRAVPHLPLVVIASAAMRASALDSGADECLTPEEVRHGSAGRAIRHLLARRAAEDALYVERERARAILAHLGSAVITTDGDGRIVEWNAVAGDLTGRRAADVQGRPFTEVCPLHDGEAGALVADPLTLAHGTTCRLCAVDGSERVVRVAASPITTRTGAVAGAAIVLRPADVRGPEAAAPRVDALTGLPDRLRLDDRLRQAMAVARRQGRPLAVLFVDLDGFKPVNDTMGHAAGDALLRIMAERLVGAVRRSDTVSRYGGDEFVIILPDADGVEDTRTVIEKIQETLSAPCLVAGRTVALTASIGASLFPDAGHTPEDLLERADVAMYVAKASGGGCARIFEDGMRLPGTPAAAWVSAPGSPARPPGTPYQQMPR
ncbi:MAG: diguanylate cyclase [Vicinamibacterales bacterium]